jgi:tRNA1Val (adenine37-N6)-methyltransferase
MSNQYFRFKQFAVRQENAAMKVGTDGVLLGAWANVDNAKRILDIGTGTGLIAMMLAQRSDAPIDAVEIDEPSYLQAKYNVSCCSWGNRILLFNESFQDFAQRATQKYDLIVSNPPYFIKSLKSPEQSRTAARHSEMLSQEDLLIGIERTISENGRFVGVFPFVEGNIFTAKASNYGLFCAKRVTILGKEKQPPKRLLLEFCRQKSKLEESTLTIRKLDDSFTNEYKRLTKDFYLAF